MKISVLWILLAINTGNYGLHDGCNIQKNTFNKYNSYLISYKIGFNKSQTNPVVNNNNTRKEK